MDREKLTQYRNLCLEIKELEKKIDNLKAREISDKVLASSPEFPYNQYQLVNGKIKMYRFGKIKMYNLVKLMNIKNKKERQRYDIFINTNRSKNKNR